MEEYDYHSSTENSPITDRDNNHTQAAEIDAFDAAERAITKVRRVPMRGSQLKGKSKPINQFLEPANHSPSVKTTTAHQKLNGSKNTHGELRYMP